MIFLIFPQKLAKRLAKPFRPLALKLAPCIPYLKEELASDDVEFIASSLMHSFLYGFLFFLIFLPTKKPLLQLLGFALLVSVVLLAAILFYPRIQAGKKAEQIEKHLVFSLKDLTLQVSSGISLYTAMQNISQSGYGHASKEFEAITRHVNAGLPLEKALEKQAAQSRSAFLRKTIWQLVSTIRAGASVEGALRSIIKELTQDQKRKIQDYGRELSLWSLLYMLFAVAIPTIGATLLVILSGFAGYGMSESAFILFLVITFIIQIVLIGFVKSRRPIVTI